jgi:uncharacterized Zn finger protein
LNDLEVQHAAHQTSRKISMKKDKQIRGSARTGEQSRFPGAESMTMNDLVEWAGSKIVSRGRKYQQAGQVSEVAITAEGVILADVAGTELYSVAVRTVADGGLHSLCTCPYAVDCKHGVAALLEYLDRLKERREIRDAGPNDERLLLLAPAESGDAAISAGLPDAEQIETYLQGLNKQQLIAKRLALANDLPEVRAGLRDSAQARAGNVKSLLNDLRREIRRVSRQEAWSDAWSDRRSIPDYSGVRRKMRALLETGQADALLQEGEELLQRGIEQIESSNDEGETCSEIAECVPLLAQALRDSSLPEEKKLSWALGAAFDDEYDLCGALEKYLQEDHSPAAWSAVADTLLARLSSMPVRAEGYASGYRRDRVGDWAIHALEHSGRGAEVLPLCEEEARKNGSYTRLVGRLMQDARYAEAEHWIAEGISHVERHAPGNAAQLRAQLREIRMIQEDWPSLALLETEEFVAYPSTEDFVRCRTSAQKIGVWPALRQTLLDYLEQGAIPWEHASWPLPGRAGEVRSQRQARHPMVEQRINIAILEKKPEDVLAWFSRLPETHGYFSPSLRDRVAKAVQEHAPDRAVAIWKDLAERLVALVKPGAYAEAGGYLRNVGKILRNHGQEDEWQACLASLRNEHRRKKRFLEVLDQLDEKPLVGGKR